MQTCIRIGGAIGLIALLSACGSTSSVPGATKGAPQTLEAEIGSGFATLFDASTTSQPATPTDTTLPALAPAAQPQVQPGAS